MYQNFIGIDIGKDEIFIAVHGDKKSKDYRNNKSGFTQFIKDYKCQLKNSLVVLETTGGYEISLITFLQQNNHSVHRANTRKVKSFIRSYGQLGKSDNIDALALAKYAYERHETLHLYVENPKKNLVKLVMRRNELKKIRTQEKNRLKAPDMDVLKESFNAIIVAINEQIAIVDEKIELFFKEDLVLQKQREILITIPGIGDITAKELLSTMPELGTINRKQIASLGGVAPHPNESGKKIGYRYMRGGRQNVKPVLFMAALAASKSKSRLGDFYRKLVAAGKKKMVAMAALMRKILVIANAKIRDFLVEYSALEI